MEARGNAGGPVAGGATAQPPSERTRVRRAPQRARYDRETVESILDDGLFAHVGFAVEDRPFVLPMVYGRREEELVLHGSAASRLLRGLRDGVEVCVAVTHVDGIVLARSAFHTSVNYRSVVLFGRARPLEDTDQKLEALRAVVEHAAPGRWDAVRVPDATELRRTLVLVLPIDEASAKVRTGPPLDDESDMASGAWAGVIPVRVAYGEPIPDPLLEAGIEPTPEVAGYRGPGRVPDLSARGPRGVGSGSSGRATSRPPPGR